MDLETHVSEYSYFEQNRSVFDKKDTQCSHKH